MLTRWTTALLLLAAMALAGCQRQAPVPTDAELNLTPQQVRGRRAYDAHCLVCHEAYSTNETRGPTLMGFYKKKYMLSGQPVNDERVRDIIVMGKAKMPGYGNVLSHQDVIDMIEYMKTL